MAWLSITSIKELDSLHLVLLSRNRAIGEAGRVATVAAGGVLGWRKKVSILAS